MTWLDRFLKKAAEKDGTRERRPSAVARKEPLQMAPTGGTVLRGAAPTANAAGLVAPASSLPTFSDGARIADAYTIKQRLGAGAMGTVYLARHEQWDHDVVLKVPNAEILADPENRHRIAREAEVWTDLGLHPHIAYCHYVHLLNSIPIMVIEYLDGGNLRDWITEGKCADLKVGLDLVTQFCHALEHAHAKGVVHRDIKPENVLLAKDGTLKLTDFGIARAVHADVGKAGAYNVGPVGQTVGSIGTYEYMAPEQFAGTREIDARADIFAFGVCLYEMFCGQRPYGEAVGQRQPVPEPAALRGDQAIPEQLCELMRRCVDWDRDGRPASAAEVNKLLRELCESLNDDKITETDLLAVPGIADVENNRAMSYLALGNVEQAERAWESALAVDPRHLEANYNLGLHLWRSGRMTDEALVQRLHNLESPDGDPTLLGLLIARVHLERGDAGSARRILEGLGSTDLETQQALAAALRIDDGGLESPIVLDGLGFSAAVLSADGRYAFTGNVAGALEWWDLAGPRCLHKLLGHEKAITCLSLTNDGRHLVSGSDDHTLRVWDLSTKLCIRMLKGHKGAVKTLSLAGGSGFAVSSGEEGVIKLWDLDRGKCLHDYVPGSARRPAHLKEWDIIVVSGRTQYQVEDARLQPGGAHILEFHSGYLENHPNEVRLFETQRPYRWTSALEVDWGLRDFFTAIDVGEDGLAAVSGHADGTVRFWDLKRQACTQIMRGRYPWIRSLMLRANSSQAVSLTAENREYGDAVLTFWSTSSGRCLRSIKLPGHSPRRLLASNGDDIFVLSDYRQGGRAGTAIVRVRQTSQPSAMRLSKGVSSAAAIKASSGYRDALRRSRRLIESGEFLAGASALREARCNVGFKRGAEAVRDWASLYVRLRRKTLRDGWEAYSLPGHSSAIAELAISNDSLLISSCDSTARVQIWSLANSSCVRQFHVQELSPYGKETPQCIALSPDGRRVAVGAEHRRIWLYEIGGTGDERTSIDSTEWIDTFALSKGGQTYTIWREVGKGATIWENGVDAWPGPTGKCLGHLPPQYSDQSGVSSTSDDERYFVYQPSRFLQPRNDQDKLLDRKLSKDLCILRQHDEDRVRSICFSPDGRLVAYAGRYFGPEIHDIQSGSRLSSFPCESIPSSMITIRFTQDGMGVVRIYSDGRGELLDVPSASIINRWSGPGNPSVARIGPDARFVVYCSQISAVKQRMVLFETATGLVLNSFDAEAGQIDSIALSVDGRHAVSGGPDKIVRVWDLGSGYCIGSFAGHVDAITTVDLSADARYALSGGREGSIKVWFLDWDLDENKPSDWDPSATPYLEAFLRAHQPYASDLPEKARPPADHVARGLSRAGRPVWNEADFQELLYQLGCCGYGWLRPEVIRKELERMTASFQGTD